MLKFDSWPPEQGKVHFTDNAFEVVFRNFTDRTATFTAARGIASLLMNNSRHEASRIFADLGHELPTSGITAASNGVDDIMPWNPQETFFTAVSPIFETSSVSVRGEL